MQLYFIREILSQEKWHHLITEFEDANLYQMWNYGKIVMRSKVKHLALYDNDELIALVQVRFKLVPLLKRGIAYIFGGPVWRKKNKVLSKDILVNIYYSLFTEFCIKNKLFLRINPNVFEDDIYYKEFSARGFIKRNLTYNHRTIFLNLEKDLDEIRMSFKQRFRKTLNKAEKNNIEIISGTDPQLFDEFISLYNELVERKRFKKNVSPSSFFEFNKQLEPKFKMVIFIAKVDGEPISALIGSAIGSTGIALFSASNEKGMKLGASVLLHWERIKWFKKLGCKRYDLGGVDPDKNRSVYEFKLGISKDEYAHVGIFESNKNKFSKFIVVFAELLRNAVNRL